MKKKIVTIVTIDTETPKYTLWSSDLSENNEALCAFEEAFETDEGSVASEKVEDLIEEWQNLCPFSKEAESEPEPFYYGKKEAEMYGDLITSRLAGKTISKCKAKGDMPGGLVYEADMLGIDMWELLAALEGMCHNGQVVELDDSTYYVNADNDKDRIIKQIMSIRDSGEINMFDVRGVQALAHRKRFYDLVCFLEDRHNKEKYCEFILHGTI